MIALRYDAELNKYMLIMLCQPIVPSFPLAILGPRYGGHEKPPLVQSQCLHTTHSFSINDGPFGPYESSIELSWLAVRVHHGMQMINCISPNHETQCLRGAGGDLREDSNG
jgi:hypothetical protein